MYELFQRASEMYGDRKCLGWRPKGEDGTVQTYKYWTYKETRDLAMDVAAALMHIGVGSKGKIGVYSKNCPEWMVIIRAADSISGTIVPIYDSLGAQAVEYVTKHSEASVVLVETDKMEPLAQSLPAFADQLKAVVYLGKGNEDAKKLIARSGVNLMSWDEFVSIGKQNPLDSTIPPDSEDISCIMYTSGTTGTPKGVMISHRAIVSGIAGALDMIEQTKIGVSEHDSLLSYMPLAHIFDRLLEDLALTIGASVGYWQGDVKKLMDDVAEFKPTLFIAVPRILERVCDAVEHKVAKESTITQGIFNCGFALKHFMLKQGFSHNISGIAVDHIVFGKVRTALGGKVRFIVSGGAPLSAHVEDFCTVCLAPVLQGYGLTETCAASFIMLPDPRMAYSVGPPLLPTEFRLESVPELNYDAAADPPKGEIVIRSPMLFSGYYKDEEKTKAEFDEDGFFHTGDIGTITEQGCLKIIDRKKNIFKLAQGEYVAVEFIEGIYSRNENIEQIWVYGSSTESALVAIVVPKQKWKDSHPNLDDPDVKKEMLEELKKTAKDAKLKGFEMIRNVSFDPEGFTIENELMTPSMKLKRPQLKKKFENVLDAMYAEMKR